MSDAINGLFKQLKNPDIHFITEAEIYQQILNSGYTQEKLGIEIKKSQSSIANKVRLLNLSQACRNIIIAKDLKERHARALLKVLEEKRMYVLMYVVKHNLSVKKMEDYINSNYELYEKPVENKQEINNKTKSFIVCINKQIKRSVENGMNIMAKKWDKIAWTDILIRIYK